jgi:Tfp pilus assembly protein PilN
LDDRRYPDVSPARRLDILQKTHLEQEQTMYIGLGVIVLILAVVLVLSLMRRSSI